MDISTALDFVREHPRVVLVTLKRDGRPQLSNVASAVGDDGTIRISITADRAKARNLARDPRASVHATREDFYAYVVVEGDAELSPVTTDPHDATADELVDLYRAIAGEHPDWEDYRAAMVQDARQVIRIRPTHAYGMLP